jgi:GxxExxY protein
VPWPRVRWKGLRERSCPRTAKVRVRGRPEQGIVVFYDDVIVGEYSADRLVEDKVIVELKVAGGLSDVHVPQCRNYLRAPDKPRCLLINICRTKVGIRHITTAA